jgi:hypothetical protein
MLSSVLAVLCQEVGIQARMQIHLVGLLLGDVLAWHESPLPWVICMAASGDSGRPASVHLHQGVLTSSFCG